MGQQAYNIDIAYGFMNKKKHHSDIMKSSKIQ